MDHPSAPAEPVVFPGAGGWIAGDGAAVAVGNFDGVHVGHAEIVRRLRVAADRRGVPALALTFDPHPASVVRPGTAPVPLTTPGRRVELLLALGLDAVLVQPVDARFVAVAAEAFYRDVLRGRLRAVALVEGADFRFGAGRRGDVGLLAALAAADGVAVEVVEPVVVGGEAVSSSRVRALVAAGDQAAANRLLTAPYRVTGTVVHGAHRGAGRGRGRERVVSRRGARRAQRHVRCDGHLRRGAPRRLHRRPVWQPARR
jgi:riboflavin kinase/FMN adenylyltransferase